MLPPPFASVQLTSVRAAVQAPGPASFKALGQLQAGKLVRSAPVSVNGAVEQAAPISATAAAMSAMGIRCKRCEMAIGGIVLQIADRPGAGSWVRDWRRSKRLDGSVS
jgi:hypothetical protein